MKILITGADGQLGRALGRGLRDHEITGLVHGQLDITVDDGVRVALENERPELVINAAAFTDVDGSESNSETAFLVNAVGPEHLARATARHGIPLVQVSTDYVFDGLSALPYTEFDLTHPISVYGASKLAGEEAVRLLNPMHYIVRTAWLYDRGGRNFPNLIRERAGSGEVRVVDDQRGSPTYAPHLVEAIGRLIVTRSYGTYHIAGRGGTTRCELTRALFAALGITTSVTAASSIEFPTAAARPRFSELATAMEPEILLPPWQEGVEAFARDLAVTGQ